ncbi:dynein heavy chain 1, cytosolic [Puccinia sorghi]|uniref:Dynein heavy chain 1, cytosolic n=1 Tax=Puccinia sorghi TaxID=27349 RepID=A0A0L6VCH4_9BASI|nr:dynein heavy chain 1, cytosolic [Puccinia sorghi]
MKLSPYYKTFEEDTTIWTDCLNRMSEILDKWIDVQRQGFIWKESSPYLGSMKRVFKSPYILDVIQIPELLKTLDKLVEYLGKLQKALGEYLERKWSSFPRFYFDILRVVKHLKKMFAGLSTLSFDSDLTQIEKMCSQEGEEVPFSKFKRKCKPLWQSCTAKLSMSLVNSIRRATHLTKINSFNGLTKICLPLQTVLRTLDFLAFVVLGELIPVMRRKCKHFITKLVHQRDLIRLLIKVRIDSITRFEWLYHMRFYLKPSIPNPTYRLLIHMANTTFPYGFEYLGVPDRLVQTPLTDRCNLTLTQALHGQLGGSPFGPAGTGEFLLATI